MATPTNLPEDRIRDMLSKLPDIMAGRQPDTYGLGSAFALGFAVACYSTISQAFVVKARGGTDEAGISWPPLTREYVAYGRRPGKSHKTTAANFPSVTLTKGQREAWWRFYRQCLAWQLAAGNAAAKAVAAGYAWNQVKAMGAQTKLDKYGDTKVEILRDTGLLLNSLSPLLLKGATASGPELHSNVAASGQGSTSSGSQVTDFAHGRLTVGTTVPYAGRHHNGKRKLWPESSAIPQVWLDRWAKAGAAALGNRLKIVASQIAAGRI